MRWMFGLLASLLLTTGCSPASLDRPADLGRRPGGSAQNWDNPIDGVRMRSSQAAQEKVPFEIIEPRNLGAPLAIYVTPPQHSDPAGRVIAYVYDPAEYGRVVIKELVSEIPPEDWEAHVASMVARNGEPGLLGRFDAVTIRGGKTALVTTSEDGSESALFWLEGPVQVVIRGPELTFNEVVSIAESL